MEEFLIQIKKALENKLYLVALQSILTIPDICAALSSKNSRTNENKYIKWYNKNVKDKQNLTGKDCYGFRCAMLHQGIMEHKKIEYSRVFFLVPNDFIHFKCNTFLEINGSNNAINLDLLDFCNEMINCASEWWEKNKEKDTIKKNYEKFVKYHANGLPPFLIGLPVIG